MANIDILTMKRKIVSISGKNNRKLMGKNNNWGYEQEDIKQLLEIN